jgi:hypothetical protein
MASRRMHAYLFQDETFPAQVLEELAAAQELHHQEELLLALEGEI